MKTQQFTVVNTDAVEAHEIASLCMAIFDPPLSLRNSASAQREIEREGQKEREREPNKSVVACSCVFMAALYMCVYLNVCMYVCFILSLTRVCVLACVVL